MILINTKYVDGIGFIQEEYRFDENKTNYEVVFKNGNRIKQVTPFHYLSQEWEEGFYDRFVAKFATQDGMAWYTPIELLCFMINDGASINGIERIKK